MNRFYEEVAAVDDEGGWRIELDGRPVRTPGSVLLKLPTEAIAAEIVREWQEQGDKVEPASMPLTRLANTALDRTAQLRTNVVDQIAAYGKSDLLCYRAGDPPDLVALQDKVWQPLLDWMSQRHGAALITTIGVAPVEQDPASMRVLFDLVSAFDNFSLTGLHSTTSIIGSLVVALALAAGEISVDDAWRAAVLEEVYQADNWGDDPGTVRLRQGIKDEIAVGAQFIALSRAR
jgi:chaperone required for assembly of F1-ATPase